MYIHTVQCDKYDYTNMYTVCAFAEHVFFFHVNMYNYVNHVIFFTFTFLCHRSLSFRPHPLQYQPVSIHKMFPMTRGEVVTPP